jgi:tetratricopeptide (TPR) repeat protein
MHNKEDKTVDLQGKVITFYSYKGGVGRSMSLVNIACLMAKQKKKVLLIDWDLEAPGLHTFFNDTIKREDLGLVDFITDVNEFIKIEANNTDEGYVQFLTDNLDNYIFKNLNIESSSLQIDIIKAGKFDDDYSDKLNAINWINFYRDSPAFFRTFAQFLEKKYDYILIDSRTGLADTSGVCTMLMPQILVLVFALNKQNIDGVIEVAKQSVNYRFESNDFRNITVLPLPSRIDTDNSTELEKWIEDYKVKFEDLFKELYLLDDCILENYFNRAKIPYKSSHAYGENIPVLKENPNNDSFISYHYAQFLKLLEDSTQIWDILSEEQLKEKKKEANSYFQKGLEYYYGKEYEKSIKEYEKSCELVPTSDANFYNNWGVAISALAKIKEGEEKEKYFKESFVRYQKAVELNPNDDSIYNNWGISIKDLAKIKEGAEKEILFKKSFEKYQKATELNPTEGDAYNNWGVAYAELANIKKGEEKEKFLKECFEKLQKAIELNSKDDYAYNNYGNAIYELARIKKGSERESLFKESFKKYQKATELNLTYVDAYNNWGNAIADFAKIKEGEEKEKYCKDSLEKYKKVIELNPTLAIAYDSLGSAIYELAKIKKEAEKESLFNESEQKLLKGIDLGNSVYNLSCLYAVWGKKGKALKHLEEVLINKEQTVSYVNKDNDWENYLADNDYLVLIEKYN